MIGLLLTAVAAGMAPQSGGVSRLLVVTGLAGEPQYATQFSRIGKTVVDAARQRWGLRESQVTWLAETAASEAPVRGRATRDAVLAALARIAGETGPDDVVVVVIAGHGSEQGNEPRLNLPGPDLTGTDLALALAAFDKQMVVVVNTASASGGFVKALAGPRRIVVTATKSGFERNATMFGDFFARALGSDEADTDKNGRLSVAEAYQFARGEVVRAYQGANRLLTEHAQLDDNGDGVGVAELAATGDGAVARLVSFSLRAEETSTDPKVAALLAERRRLETAIAALRGRKATMDSTAYERELEALLVRLAETNQAIREGQAKP
ncbi:MAG: hypothetical protein JNJ80_05690 [Gemmatimonadetes bacterium]|nr:hypothetical protein [Gemmatimonadota bacterium]